MVVTTQVLLGRLRYRAKLAVLALLCLLVVLPVLPLTASAGPLEGPAAKKSASTTKSTSKSSTKKKSTSTKTTSKKKTSSKSSKSSGKKSTRGGKSSVRKSGKSGTRAKGKRNSRSRARKSRGRAARPVPAIPYASAIVVDAESGAVLYHKDADATRTPASLVKMMTELVVLEAIDRGELSLDEGIIVPDAVRQVGGSKVYLVPGEEVSLRDVLHAMMIASANDAAVTLAYRVAGSESAFVALMNRRASELGMTNTVYANPHGLDRPECPTQTTARDQSTLARHLILHPSALALASTVQDTIRGGQIVHNTNKLLGSYGVDGLKTGYTGKAGYCLCSTACRSDMRVVSVVLGSPSSGRRFEESARLLDTAFVRYQKVKVMQKGQDTGRTVPGDGDLAQEIKLVASDDIHVLVKADSMAPIRVRVDTLENPMRPLRDGEALGMIEVLVGDSVAARSPAVAENAKPAISPLERVLTRIVGR